MSESLLHVIAAICAAPGVVMLLFPRSFSWLEEALAREWGQQPIFALRIGLPAERRAEEVLNRRLLGRTVVWDDLLRRNPRATGVGLCAAAVLLWLAA